MPIWSTNREEGNGWGKRLYWFKIWDLKDVEKSGNQGLYCSGCNWCLGMVLKNISRYVENVCWEQQVF